MKFVLLLMFNLISLFRGIGIAENPYKFGHGSFWKVIGPVGFFVGQLLGGGDGEENKIPYIIGVVFNVAVIASLILFS